MGEKQSLTSNVQRQESRTRKRQKNPNQWKRNLRQDIHKAKVNIKILNPAMGVPITFLDKYNPDQFEILGLGNSRENFTPNKDYINPKKILRNGDIKNGNAINCVLAINYKNRPEGIYYTSDNSDYLVAPYARILIRSKRLHL